MQTIKTKLHYYNLNLEDEKQAEEYQELRQKLKNTEGRGRWLNTWSISNNDRLRNVNGVVEEVELETSWLSDNQWNTVDKGEEKGFRVFDWYEAVYQNPLFKQGHYLEITQEMIDLRNDTLICPYDGKIVKVSDGFKAGDINYDALTAFGMKSTSFGMARFTQLMDKSKKGFNLPELTPKQTKDISQEYIKRNLDIQDEKKYNRTKKDLSEKLKNVNHDIKANQFIYNNNLMSEHIKPFIYKGKINFNIVDELLREPIELIMKSTEFNYEIKVK